MDLKDFEQTKKILFKHEIMEELVKSVDKQCVKNIGVFVTGNIVSSVNIDQQFYDDIVKVIRDTHQRYCHEVEKM